SSSEGQESQQHANHDVRLASAIGNSALAFDLDFKLRNGAGKNGIVRAEIARADEATEENGLAIVANGDVASRLHDKRAIGESLDDFTGEAHCDIRAHGGSTFAVEAGIGSCVEEILQAVG